jgi:hypothetical protein
VQHQERFPIRPLLRTEIPGNGLPARIGLGKDVLRPQKKEDGQK